MAKKKSAASPNPDDGKQDIEALTKRYQKLNKRQIEAQTDLRNAEKQLDDLRKKARKEYETDDLEELRQKLDAMKKENEQKRAEYQQSLDTIEADLKQVEEAHKAAAAGVAEEANEEA